MATREDKRQRVLGGLLIGFAVITMFALFDVLATVFFAVTVAYVLSPARRWVRRRGVGRRLSTVIVTLGAAIGTILVFAPIAILLFYRLDEVFILLAELPDVLEIQIADQRIEFVLDDGLDIAVVWLRQTAIAASTALPVLLVKFALFVFVVFALLDNERDIGESLYSVVPPRYRDIAEVLHFRARDTLFAIYVLQGMTAFATVLIAIPLFYLFGYESWLALATIAGIMQFVPVIGPSILILVLAGAEILTGSLLTGVLMLVIGGIFIAAFPDVVIRPRLAKMTTELSSALYFVGFVGGLLSLGAIGVIIGPLLIALLAEVYRLVSQGFAAELPPDEQPA